MTTGLTAAESSFRRLDCIESENLTGVLIPRADGRELNADILQFYHGTKFSDGDIYRKVRHYQLENNDSAANEWIQKLSHCKQVGLKQLLEKRNVNGALESAGIVDGLDALLDFPGLWIGLELGNIRRILAMHCDEEIIRYLRHIRLIWSRITLQEACLKGAVDTETVKALQLRAPAVSIHDQDFIGTAMDSRVLFQSVTDPDIRTAIKIAIDKVPCIIPSIKTLHENSKLLGLGSKVLRELVTKSSLRTSLYKTLLSNWKAPKDTIVEVAEGEFRYTKALSSALSWSLVYKQIWFSALRHNPELTGIPPRKEKGSNVMNAGINICRQHQFVLFVGRLGIETPKTRQRLEKNPRREALKQCINQIISPQCPSPKHQEDMLDHMQQALSCGKEVHQVPAACSLSSQSSEILERRWGRPFQNTFIAVKEQFFLPNLVTTVPPKSHSRPTALFVRKDFIDAFFGTTAELALSATTDVLQSPPMPSNSTTNPAVANYSGPEFAPDQIDRMSIDLADQESNPEAKHAENVSTTLNISRPFPHLADKNSFEKSVNFTTKQQTDVPNQTFLLSAAQPGPKLNYEFPNQLGQPRSPIDQQLKLSPYGKSTDVPIAIPDYISMSQVNVEGQSEEPVPTGQAITTAERLRFSFSGSTILKPDHRRSPIAIACQMTGSKLSPIIEPKSKPLLGNDHVSKYPALMQIHQSQVPINQTRQHRRSPIASVGQNSALNIQLNSRETLDLTQTDPFPQGLSETFEMQTDSTPRNEGAERPERSPLDDQGSSISAAARTVRPLAAPAAQAMPSTSDFTTQVIRIFDASIGIPEVSIPDQPFDKVVDMTDIFDSGLENSNMAGNFISGKSLPKPSYKFFFYNGMTLNASALTKDEMEKYLQKRPSSVMLALSGNAGTNPSRKRQVWRSIPRRKIVAQMSAEPHLTYVLTIPEKAQWWMSNGSLLLKEKKLRPSRKYRHENPNLAKVVENQEAVVPNPWAHNHDSDSLNVLSETHYPAGTMMESCEKYLANSRLESQATCTVLQYNEAKVCTLVAFDINCEGKPCFQTYFRGYSPIYEESNTVGNTQKEENLGAIIWMVDSRVTLDFKEERYLIPRSRLAGKRRIQSLNVGGPFLGQDDLFEPEDIDVEESRDLSIVHADNMTGDGKYPHPQKSSMHTDLVRNPKKETKNTNKRGPEEIEERSRTMLLAMPSHMEVQEPKRHKENSLAVNFGRSKSERKKEESKDEELWDQQYIVK